LAQGDEPTGDALWVALAPILAVATTIERLMERFLTSYRSAKSSTSLPLSYGRNSWGSNYETMTRVESALPSQKFSTCH
jgi:hypothetical protein